jgi:hypothetical protein
LTPLVAPEPQPPADTLAAWRQAAWTGDGTPWLRAHDADALARHALGFDEGVHMMEATAGAFCEPPRDISWEILGADEPGQNWIDHRDPKRAYILFRGKLHAARSIGAVLRYKIWLRRTGD